MNLFEKRISSAVDAPDVFPATSDKNNGPHRSLAGRRQNSPNAILHLPHDRDFLEAAYWLVLGRACDPIGLAGYMEALHNHVPRQTILRELSQSEEATKNRPSTEAARRRTLKAWLGFFLHRRILAPIRHLLRRVLLARFDSLDYRLNFVLEELSRRNDTLSQKLDDTGVVLSQRQEAMGEEVLRHRERIGGLERVIEKSETLAASRQESLIGYWDRLDAQSRTQIASLDQILKKNEILISESNTLRASLEPLRASLEPLRASLESLRASVEQANSAQSENALTIGSVVEQIGQLNRRTEELQKLSVDLRKRSRPPLVRAAQDLLVTEADGFILGIPGDEWRLAAYYAFRGVPEPGPIALFKSLVKQDMTVVDVGANIGIYSLHAAQILAGKGRVHSFEPVPKIHQILRDNIQVNGFLETGTVQLHQLAIADWEGRSEFAVFPSNWGHSTLFPGDRDADRITVDVRTLDQILGDARVDVVKIDAEGSELNVLRGMRNVIARNPGISILMEFGPSNLVRAKIAPQDLLDWLEANDISYARVDDLSGELMKTCQSELLAAFSTMLCLSPGTPAATGER